MTEQSVAKWYDISIGWGPEKSWFLVDELPRPQPAFSIMPQPAPEQLVEVKHVAGEVREIRVQAQFPHLPTLGEAMTVVLQETQCDHSGEVKYHLTSRKDGLLQPRYGDLERLRRCVPAEGDGGAS